MPLFAGRPSEGLVLGAGDRGDKVEKLIGGPDRDEEAHSSIVRRDAPVRAILRPVPITAIDALHADITTLAVDAVVNAANSTLGGGGGVDGAIHRAAGWADLQAACSALGGCDTGDAKATSGFALPARYIIHTVGPIWRGGFRGESELLASCYRRCLEVADSLGVKSIAFPAISTGVYEYPPNEAAHVAVETVRSTYTSVETVKLVAFDTPTYELYRRLLSISF
jgi:O-acetyl-ADP-ribose deacetylase